MKVSDLRLRIASWTPGVSVPTSISQIRSAISQARQGRFSGPALTAESLLVDDEFSGALDRSLDYLFAATFSLTPGKGRGAETLAEKLTEQFPGVWSECAAREFLRWYRLLGVAVATIDWSKDWVPTVRVLHPRYLEWDDNREAYTYETRGGRVDVKPGDGKWIVAGNRSTWQSSGLVSLGETWFGKRQTWRDLLRYCERHGMPIMLLKIPGFVPDAEQDKFIEDASALGSDSTLALPTHLNQDGAEFGADMLEAKDQAYEVFLETLARCDRKFQVWFLGSNAGSELTGNVGSRAASESSAETSVVKASAIAREFCTVIREQLLTPWVSIVYGGLPVPWPSYQLTPSIDKSRAETWSAMAGSVSAWQMAGYQVDNIVDLASELGITISESPVEENTQGEDKGAAGASANKPTA